MDAYGTFFDYLGKENCWGFKIVYWSVELRIFSEGRKEAKTDIFPNYEE